MEPPPEANVDSAEIANSFSRAFDVDDEDTTARVRQIAPPLNGPRCPIQVIPVHTFILQGHSKDVRLRKAIVVPSFASHWGVVVGVPGARTLYHLVFDKDEDIASDARPDSIIGRRRAVKLDYSAWNKDRDNAPTEYVGDTQYSHEQRIEIGNKLLEAFGSYHRVFWNCQAFAKCYLEIVCTSRAASFQTWTLADAASMVLCAFVVTAPLATTIKTVEIARIQNIIKAVQSTVPPSDEELEELSDRAIDILRSQALAEPANREILGVLPASKPGLFKWLITLIFGHEAQTPN